MKKMHLVVVLAVLALAGGFWWYQHHVDGEHRPDRGNTDESLTFAPATSQDGDKPTQPDGNGEGHDAGMFSARLDAVVDSPLRGSTRGEKALAYVDGGGAFEKTIDGVRVMLYPSDSFGPHMPMVALRFLKKDEATGELRALTVEHCLFRRRNGNVTDRCTKEREMHGHRTVEGHTMWLAAAAPGAPAVRALRFGRRYHLEYKVVTKTKMHRGSAVEDEYYFYESIVKVPDHIPPGKMAVIDVIAEHLDGTIEETPRPDLTYITGSITQPLPPTQTAWYAAYTHEEEEYSGFTRIEDNGMFNLGERKLGGMLRLAEKGGNGVSWMYVNEVRQDELTLPADADLVIPRDQIQTVKVAVPAAALKQKMVGLWVKRDRDDSGPLSWVACRRPVQEQLQKTQTVDVQLPPGAGEYWVDAFYGFDAKGERNWVTLGRIAPGPTPNDTPLEIVPPED